MHPIKIRRSGNSLGATLPKEVLQKLKVRPVRSLGGGTIKTISTDWFQITAYDPDFEAAMQAFAETRKNYRNALRELAK